MALATFCVDCGATIPRGSRCPGCAWKRNAAYAPDRMRGRRWQRRRAAALRNASWVCQRCHRAIAEEVHHRDGDPGNNSFLNLLPVCRDCHRELEAEKRATPRDPCG